MTEVCATCHAPLADPAPLKLRYESRLYAFDKEVCKRIFQENPDRYLDADGGIRPEPR
ncbi:MAG TPA: YHS domain-containing protein [Candidatus Limnocylindria bacterium]